MGVEAGCIGIVGLGLIGGSIGLDLRSHGVEVQGLVHRQQTADRAMARGLISAVSTDPSCLQRCDLWYLLCPSLRFCSPIRPWWTRCRATP